MSPNPNKHLSRLTFLLAGALKLPVTNGAGENVRQKDILAPGDDASAYWPPNVLPSVAIDTCGQLKGTGGLAAGKSGKLSSTVCTYCSCMK